MLNNIFISKLFSYSAAYMIIHYITHFQNRKLRKEFWPRSWAQSTRQPRRMFHFHSPWFWTLLRSPSVSRNSARVVGWRFRSRCCLLPPLAQWAGARWCKCPSGAACRPVLGRRTPDPPSCRMSNLVLPDNRLCPRLSGWKWRFLRSERILLCLRIEDRSQDMR